MEELCFLKKTVVMMKGGVRDFSRGPMAKTPPFQCRGPRFNPGQGNSPHMQQIRVWMPQLSLDAASEKILHAAARTWHSQMNEFLKTIKKKRKRKVSGSTKCSLTASS